MAWAIIAIYISKCAQMDLQQLLKTSKFYFRSKKCDIKKTLPTPLGSSKVNERIRISEEAGLMTRMLLKLNGNLINERMLV